MVSNLAECELQIVSEMGLNEVRSACVFIQDEIRTAYAGQIVEC